MAKPIYIGGQLFDEEPCASEFTVEEWEAFKRGDGGIDEESTKIGASVT